MNAVTLTTRRALALLLLASAVTVAGTAPVFAAHVDPVLVPGNPDCGDLGFAIGFKIDPPIPGTYPFVAGPNTVFTGLSAPDPANSFTFTSPDGIYFDWTSTLPLDVVIVKGGPDANVYNYSPEETSDTGLHSPINPSNGTPFAISHIEICYDYEVTVSKTAETSFTRTWDWSIDKSVTPDVWQLFTGDTGTSKYSVTATKDGFTDSDWAVEGEIVIDNATPFDATVTGVSDIISGPFPAPVDCGGAFPQVIPAGGSLSCSYGPVALPSGITRTNTATVTTEGLVGGGQAEASVEFTTPTTEVNATVNVTDTNGPSWVASDTTTWMYERTFACDGDQGTHPNVATIVETGDSDNASVTVACYELTVTKNADTSFTRTWEWAIDKSADQSELTLSPGQIFLVNYSVLVDATAADSDWFVEGEIWIANPNPALAAPLTGVSDSVQGVPATVDCPALVVPAGGSLHCTYSADLPDGSNRTNTATATLQNRSFDFQGNALPAGTTDFSGTAPVNFGDPSVVIDECVDVDDSWAGFLGTVCAADAPAEFTYSREIGPFFDPEDCGENEVLNTASFQTQDTGTTGEDSWTILVNVPCEEGCTLTPGYWKTHSAQGPAPFDDTWNQILPAAENSPFFLSGQTYLEVLWTSPRGNAYYILAHAWIAAELNQLNGASIPADVLDAFNQGRTVFETYTPEEVDGFKGQDKDKRAMILGWAFLLDEYNNGLTGPGHCSEETAP